MRIPNEIERDEREKFVYFNKIIVRKDKLIDYKLITNIQECGKISSPEILEFFAKEPINPGLKKETWFTLLGLLLLFKCFKEKSLEWKMISMNMMRHIKDQKEEGLGGSSEIKRAIESLAQNLLIE